MSDTVSVFIRDTVTGFRFSCATVDGPKNRPSLKNARFLDARSFNALLRGKDVRIAASYPDLVVAEAEIPPVKNDESRWLLFRNRLRESLRENVKYSFVYTGVPGGTAPREVYAVYAAPETLLPEAPWMSGKGIKAVKSFTFDVFALVAVSRVLEPEETVFHAYGEKDRLLVTVSRGGRLLYFRSAEPDGGVLENSSDFYYENINLTYLYARQSLGGAEMKVFLTGALAGDEKLASAVKGFLGRPPEKARPEKVLSGADEKTFNDFLIPIGTCLAGDDYDFSPARLKADRRSAFAYGIVNAVLCAVLVFSAASFFSARSAFVKEKDAYESCSASLLRTETDFLKRMGDPASLAYGATYLNMIRERTESPLRLLPYASDILAFYPFSSVAFSGSGAEARMNAVAEKVQDSFASVEEFNKKINEKIAEVARKGALVSDRSAHTLKNLKNSLNVTIAGPEGSR